MNHEDPIKKLKENLEEKFCTFKVNQNNNGPLQANNKKFTNKLLSSYSIITIRFHKDMNMKVNNKCQLQNDQDINKSV